MRPFLKTQLPRGRVATAGVLLAVLTTTGTALAQTRSGEAVGQAPQPIASGPEKRKPFVDFRQLDFDNVEVVLQEEVGVALPARCSVRRRISIDERYYDDDGNRLPRSVPSHTASLRALEIGFQRVGDYRSRNIRAFTRFRFERNDDGKPLRLERPEWSFGWEAVAYDRWNFEPLDEQGYGGAWIDLDALPIDHLGQFRSALMQTAPRDFTVTLPEIGESRAYTIQFSLSNGALAAFAACFCAMRDPHLSDKRVWDCSRR
jgi:hypothetical protein